MSRRSVPIHWKLAKLTTGLSAVSTCVIRPGIEGGDDGAVLRRGGVEIAHRRHAGGARHVLHDDVRIAGDVAAVVPRQHARIDVVAAAGGIADDQRHGLAVVERSWAALGMKRLPSRSAENSSARRDRHSVHVPRHTSSSLVGSEAGSRIESADHR